MNKSEVYASLEAKMLQYQDLITVPLEQIDEPFVPIPTTSNLVAHQLRDEMLPITGEAIYVRETVCKMLGEASMLLAQITPGVQLQVGYGYRAKSIQERNFSAQRDKLAGSVPEAQLDEATHRCVAMPEIAGHPTGGAVDVRLLRDGMPVNCGTDMWEFTPDSYTFTPYLSSAARRARMVLRSVMQQAGFAPFDGEWWHFSYGDKEWAAYYGISAAIYAQTDFSVDVSTKV